MNQLRKPVLISHPCFLGDDLPEESLESAVRLELLVEEGIFETNEDHNLPFRRLLAENGEQYLSLVHVQEYIEKIKEICQGLNKNKYEHIGDNFFSVKTFEMNCYAVGAAVQAAELARYGTKSFAVVRAPGHHAHREYGQGFCHFNNIAVATEYLREHQERVLIIDVDLHLGDGTIEYVEGKENVYYLSLNQRGLWPHMEPEDEENMENIFLPRGMTDEVYIRVLERKIKETINLFMPDIIAVSAGFDTAATDFVDYGKILKGGFNLSKETYQKLWGLLDNSLIPYFAVLEGGYSPLSVRDGVMSFFER